MNIQELVINFIKTNIIELNKNETNNDLVKAFLFIFIIVFTAVVLYFASTDKNAVISNTYTYAMLLILPFAFAFIYVLKQNKFLNFQFNAKFVVYASVAIIISFMFYYLYIQLDNSAAIVVQTIVFLLSLLIIIVGLAILFRATGNYFKKLGGVSGFVSKFIFFIPCLVSDTVQILISDYQSTPRTTIYLFWLEVLLVSLYVLFSYYRDNGIMKGTLLLKDPVFLDLGIEKTIGDIHRAISLQNKDNHRDFQYQLRAQNSDGDMLILNSNLQPQTYSLSFWCMVNPMENKQEAQIIRYGDGTKFHPKVTFGYDNALNMNVYKIYTINDVYSFKIPNQKWNQFVFVNDSSTTNLFINGKLHKVFSNNHLINTDQCLIIVGDKNNKLNGAIANVLYYTKPLTESEVVTIYNLKSFNVDTGISPVVI